MTPASDRVPLPEVRDLLQTGQALPFRVLDAQERLLLNEGHVLHDEAQYEALLARGAWAERPRVEAERIARGAAAGVAPTVPELSLFDRWERLLWQFDKLTRALARREERGSAVLPFCAILHGLLNRDPDVALFLCIRQEDRRFALYPLRHAIHCAVLVELTARQLGWDDAARMSLGHAALTMNLSMLELQASMAEQDDPPTRKQLDTIRAHPDASVALLRGGGVDDDGWLEAVAGHHEHVGGGGYPRGRADPGAAAQVLRAADVYMAKISPRAKRPPMAPQAATRQLFQQHPGDPLAMALIKTMGVYPPGSLVQLKSGEVGVSIRRPATGTHPLVATLSDRNGRPSGETHRRDTAQAEFAVVGPAQDGAAFPRVVPERVYGLIAG
ncbi:MAG: HD domain-containing phosphohydrolase [Burkholderiaceae bacterium]